MKTLKKNTFGLLLLLFPVFFLPGCGEDYEVPWGICDVYTGFDVDKELGRIYFNIDYNFYYIGLPDTTLWNWGYIPCNDIPDEYIPEGKVGMLVIYSGRIKLMVDPEEPQYYGLELTYIKKVDDGQ